MTVLLLTAFAAAGGGHWHPVAYLMFVVCAAGAGAVAAIRRRQVSITTAVVTAVVLGLCIPVVGLNSNNMINGIVFVVLLVAAAWTAGYAVRERREHASAMRTQAEVQAVTDERLRIARELHDVVAHSIGVIAIQAGVGRRVIATQPDEAAKALDVIEATSRDTLGSLRRTLNTLRGTDPQAAPREPAPGLTDLERLVASTAAGGVRVDLRWLGDRQPVPAEVDTSAYRIVQEALTNVVRHAGVSECTVTVDFRGADVFIEVIDDGRGVQASGAGYGVLGMRERAALLGGDLIACPRPDGGFGVAARLPLPVGAQ
jgi:signal transduction histidine kinase